MLKCAKEETLMPAIDAGGLDNVQINKLGEEVYIMSIKLKTKRERIYLATRRNPEEPRKFKRVDAALSVGHKLFGAKQFIVAL